MFRNIFNHYFLIPICAHMLIPPPLFLFFIFFIVFPSTYGY